MTLKNRLGYSFILLVIATICSKGLGFFREILSAKKFGLSSDFDVYLSVFILPSVITSLLSYAIPNIIIPRLKLNTSVTEDKYYSFFVAHFFWPFIFILIFLIGIYNLSLDRYIYMLGLPFEKYELAITIGRLFSLYIFFESIFIILSVMFNAQEKFVFPAFIHLTLQTSVILSLFFFAEKLGVLSIVLGLSFGAIFQVLFFLMKLKKMHTLKYFQIKFSKTDNLLGSIFVVILIELIGQLFTFADRIYVSELPDGYITGLYYANILKELPFVLFGITLGNILFPKITRMFQEQDVSLYSMINKVLLFVFLGACFTTILLMFLGGDIISILFERGAFSSENTKLTTCFFLYYAVAIPFLFLHFILVKMFYSLKKELVVLCCSVVCVMLKFFLNAFYIREGDFEKLALATSLSFMLNTILLVSYYCLFFQKQKKI